jgi:hypothetical protein
MALAAMSWQELAHGGAAPLEVQIGRLTPERQREVRAVLEAMATSEATADGVKSAWDQVTSALPGLEKPDFAGSGEGHNRSALRNAGMKVMRGLVGATAEKLKTKPELERLLTTLDALNLKPEARDLLKDEARTRFRG